MNNIKITSFTSLIGRGLISIGRLSAKLLTLKSFSSDFEYQTYFFLEVFSSLELKSSSSTYSGRFPLTNIFKFFQSLFLFLFKRSKFSLVFCSSFGRRIKGLGLQYLQAISTSIFKFPLHVSGFNNFSISSSDSLYLSDNIFSKKSF